MATAKKPSTRGATTVARQRAEAKAQAGEQVETDAANSSTQREVEFEGVTYKIPPVSDWPIEVMEFVDEARWLAAVKAVLGPEQWETYKAPGRTNSQFFVFVDKLFGDGEARAE